MQGQHILHFSHFLQNTKNALASFCQSRAEYYQQIPGADGA